MFFDCFKVKLIIVKTKSYLPLVNGEGSRANFYRKVLSGRIGPLEQKLTPIKKLKSFVSSRTLLTSKSVLNRSAELLQSGKFPASNCTSPSQITKCAEFVKKHCVICLWFRLAPCDRVGATFCSWPWNKIVNIRAYSVYATGNLQLVATGARYRAKIWLEHSSLEKEQQNCEWLALW